MTDRYITIRAIAPAFANPFCFSCCHQFIQNLQGLIA
jgi:hypothetical protein